MACELSMCLTVQRCGRHRAESFHVRFRHCATGSGRFFFRVCSGRLLPKISAKLRHTSRIICTICTPIRRKVRARLLNFVHCKCFCSTHFSASVLCLNLSGSTSFILGPCLQLFAELAFDLRVHCKMIVMWLMSSFTTETLSGKENYVRVV
jgi:hypothetical protein